MKDEWRLVEGMEETAINEAEGREKEEWERGEKGELD